ncbi:MAG: hypothetical protein ACRDLB_08220 [Actinomycetota bacterium]
MEVLINGGRVARRMVFAAVVAGALVMTGSVKASPPEAAAGEFVAPPPAPTSFRTAGNNCFTEIDDVFELTGTLEGELELDFVVTFHGPCSEFPTFPANFRAPAGFGGTVTLDGTMHTGSFEGTFNGRIDEQAVARGTLSIARGTGGLAGLHGVIVLEGTPGVGGTYSGDVHLDG